MSARINSYILTIGLVCLLAGLLFLSVAVAAPAAQNVETPVPCNHTPVEPGEGEFDQECEVKPYLTPTPVLICDPAPASCYQERVGGYQYFRSDLRPNLTAAAANLLPTAIPYPTIFRGDPPVPVAVSPQEPIPPILLRGLFWAESRWLQFGENVFAPDNTYACTLVAGDCGYGLSQLTGCMTLGGGCDITNLNRTLVGSDLNYNLSTGVHTLINKWNGVLTVGSNNHTEPEQWYEAVLSYNGWGQCNNPNRTFFLSECIGREQGFNRERHPFGETGASGQGAYPYQEVVWGWMAAPRPAGESDSPSRNLWRPTYIAHLPRGIFGLGNGWEPPDNTPKPVFHLLHNVTQHSTIVISNPTGQILAADIALYDTDHTFNRWLLPDTDPYVRINPGETRSLPVTSAMRGGTFQGYARISASTGLQVALTNPPGVYKTFLPVITTDAPPPDCTTRLSDGGFEQFSNGHLTHWRAEAEDYVYSNGTYVYTYPLADGTWLKSGHSGAYLGGYPDGDDRLLQEDIELPAGYNGGIYLRYSWYVQTLEPANGADIDKFDVIIAEEGSIRTILSDLEISNLDADNRWHEASINLRYHGVNPGDTITLWFHARNDALLPTSFFIDDVQIEVCH